MIVKSSVNDGSLGCSQTKVRVAVLVTHPIPYYVPLYRELAKHESIDLVVYFFSDYSLRPHYDEQFNREIDWGAAQLDGFEYRFLPSSRGRDLRSTKSSIQFDILREIVGGQYDALWITSYASANAIVMRLVGPFLGSRIYFRDDSTLLAPRPFWKLAIKSIVLRVLFHGAHAFFVGKANKKYWQQYGIADNRMVFAPHAVDNEYFSSRASTLMPNRSRVREAFGIGDASPVILFVGKFIEVKQPRLLLRSFAIVRKKCPCWLLLVGEGRLKSPLQEEVARQGVPNVIMPGFIDQAHIAEAYTAADIFVLPSSAETWGLAVNESMNFGLPIIVSNRVGCAADLVVVGENGFVFQWDDDVELARYIEELVGNASKRRMFGLRSKEIIGGYSFRECAANIGNEFLQMRSRGP